MSATTTLVLACPICGGQTKLVPSHRFGAGYYECIEAGRRGCDRFFREDELVEGTRVLVGSIL